MAGGAGAGLEASRPGRANRDSSPGPRHKHDVTDGDPCGGSLSCDRPEEPIGCRPAGNLPYTASSGPGGYEEAVVVAHSIR
jgi:hypothetical protein